MNTNRFRRFVFLVILLGTFGRISYAFGPSWSFQAMDHAFLGKHRTKVSINNFCFELRPEAYKLYRKNPRPFKFLGKVATEYAAFLSPGNQINCIYVSNPKELYGSTARFPGVIAMSFEDVTFLKEMPRYYYQHLLQVFLHEFGHYLFLENTNERREVIKNMYEEMGLCGSDCFSLFTDFNYSALPDGNGHPQDNENELFASAFMISLLYPGDLKLRTLVAQEGVRINAERLSQFMGLITKAFPNPTRFLKNKRGPHKPAPHSAGHFFEAKIMLYVLCSKSRLSPIQIHIQESM